MPDLLSFSTNELISIINKTDQQLITQYLKKKSEISCESKTGLQSFSYFKISTYREY